MAKTPNKTDILPKGISLHRGKMRIAFRPDGFENQVKRVLNMEVTKANIKIAEMKLNAIRHEIMLGTFDIGKHFPNDPLCRSKPYTVAEMLGEFFKEYEKSGVKRSTLSVAKYKLGLLVKAVGKCDVRNTNRVQIVELREILKKHKSDSPTYGGLVRSNREVNKLVAMLTRAADFAVERHKLDSNPFSFLRPLQREKSSAMVEEAQEAKVKVLTMEQAAKVIAALPEGFPQNFIKFCFWSGMRHGEALALEKRDLDLPYITIRRTLTMKPDIVQTPKTGNARRILLTPLAIEALKAQLPLSQSERIFDTEGVHKNMNANSIPKRAWVRALQTAAIDYVSPYVTRHSFVSWALMAGESEWKIAQHVGHKNTNMIQSVYGHFIPKSEAKWSIGDPEKLEKQNNQ